MKKREFIPALLAAAAAVVFLLIVISMPSVSFIGLDLRIAAIAGLGFLAFKIYNWSQNLFGEMPP